MNQEYIDNAIACFKFHSTQQNTRHDDYVTSRYDVPQKRATKHLPEIVLTREQILWRSLSVDDILDWFKDVRDMHYGTRAVNFINKLINWSLIHPLAFDKDLIDSEYYIRGFRINDKNYFEVQRNGNILSFVTMKTGHATWDVFYSEYSCYKPTDEKLSSGDILNSIFMVNWYN